MANSEITVTPGTGKSVDTRTTTTDANHRQVMVIGAPATDADVAPVNVTSGLKVNLGADNDVTVSGVSTSAKQLADGHNVTIDNASSDEVYVRGSGTAGTADAAVLTIQGIASMTALSVTESTPLTGFATSAKQLADGHAVTIDNAAGAAAVNIQDGGNVITVNVASAGIASGAIASGAVASGAIAAGAIASGAAVSGAFADGSLVTLGAKTDAKSTATDATSITAMQVLKQVSASVQAPPTRAVTNAGTFAVQESGGATVGSGNPTIDSYAHIAINLNAGADQVLVASAANKQIWVYSVAYTCSVAGTVSFQDEADTAVTGIMDHSANSGIALSATGNFAMPLWKLATDKDLEVDVVDAAIDGWLSYAIVSV